MNKAFHQLLLFLLLFSAAHAGEPEKVTLGEALYATLEEKPAVLAAAAEVSAAAAQVHMLESRFLPRLTFSERYLKTDEPGGSLFIDLNQRRFELNTAASAYNEPPVRSNFETRLTLRQPLFDPDLKLDRERAKLHRDAVSALLDRRNEEALLATLEAYLAVQQGHARLGWAEQSLGEADEVAAIAREREHAGVGLHADSLRSEVLRNAARRQLLVARNALHSAQRRLALTIGRVNGTVDIASPASVDAVPLPASAAVMLRGDIEASARAVDGAERAVQQRKAAYLPRVDLQASYVWNQRDLSFSDEAESWSLSAGFEWLLFDGGERSSALASARARQLALELGQKEQQREAWYAVAEAVQQAEEAGAQLELAQSSLVAAEASRELMSQRYAAGLALLSDLLAVQTELARVRSELAGAETGLIIARAKIHYAQGTLVQALFPESESLP